MKKIYLITITFNSEEETHKCLFSLRSLELTNLDLHIVVVDNASKKPFLLTETEKKLPITVLRSEKNLGFSGGNNYGITYSLEHDSDYILLLNNDTYVDKNVLQELVKVSENDELIGLVSPKIYFAKGYEYHKEKYKQNELGKVFWYAGGYTDWANVYSKHIGVDEVDKGQYSSTAETGFATGCCMLIKKEVLKKVGLFDDRYFLYYEDADFNERIKKAGYKVFYAPKAVIWHVSAASSGIGSNLHDYFLTRNRMIFGLQYAPIKTKIALFRESVGLLLSGRQWQRKGIKDFYLKKFGKGSYA